MDRWEAGGKNLSSSQCQAQDGTAESRAMFSQPKKEELILVIFQDRGNSFM